MRNVITKQMQASTVIGGVYTTPVEQPASLGSLVMKGGQCVLTFKRTVAGTGIVFKIDEYFGATGGWVTKTIQSGSDLNLLEITSLLETFSYAFPTMADKIRVYAKGVTGTESIETILTVGEIN